MGVHDRTISMGSILVSQMALNVHSINFAYNNPSLTEINTWDDWHIVASTRPVITPPSPKTKFVDIPGGNGTLDLTEVLTNSVTYNDRTGDIEFIVLNPNISVLEYDVDNLPKLNPDYGRWAEVYSMIMNSIHGQSVQLRLADDKDVYYGGRVWINQWRSNKEYSTITISYNLYPYKMRIVGGEVETVGF